MIGSGPCSLSSERSSLESFTLSGRRFANWVIGSSPPQFPNVELMTSTLAQFTPQIKFPRPYLLTGLNLSAAVANDYPAPVTCFGSIGAFCILGANKADPQLSSGPETVLTISSGISVLASLNLGMTATYTDDSDSTEGKFRFPIYIAPSRTIGLYMYGPALTGAAFEGYDFVASAVLHLIDP
jgi:hypothetical protein